MKVFKFGGASVKDAPAVRNLASIIKTYDEPLIVVVSAMGKMTNALEKVLKAYFEQDSKKFEYLDEVKAFHYNIVGQLFHAEHQVYSDLEDMFSAMTNRLSTEPSMNFNFEYDQLVSYGELISTTIISSFLEHEKCETSWVDIRRILKTDEIYREANVDFELSAKLAHEVFKPVKCIKYLTQGFIGSTQNNLTTTLGREGSDYTAALLAAFMDAESLTVWKDVPGVLNADPKWFDNTIKLDKLSYTDAIELAFYGASVLHPKTIQPVKQHNIPLLVKSFLKPEDPGTVIGNCDYEKLIPCFIFKVEQVLLNVHPRDLSFIAEHNLERIFSILAKFSFRVNLMQNTAVSFRICANNDSTRIPAVVKELEEQYKVSVLTGLELITIRYYDQETIDRVLVDKEVLLEQRNQRTVQMVVKKK